MSLVKARHSEAGVWTLLVRDFYWRPDPNLRVRILQGNKAVEPGTAKFQLFEVLFATAMALVRPDYEWYVTPNRPDGGVDFLGRTTFLSSEALGIGAAITVGGQCKKRSRVDRIEEDLGGSLMLMAQKINPTFFVVAFSAKLKRDRIVSAQECLEGQLNRHCHIFDRVQIESFIRIHFQALYPIICAALKSSEADVVQRYFTDDISNKVRPPHAELEVPDQVLAGEPFQVHILLRETATSRISPWLKWMPVGASGSQLASDGITLLAPLAVDSSRGANLDRSCTEDDNPFLTSIALEFITYAAGLRKLGVVIVEGRPTGTLSWSKEIQLPSIRVIENLCPRFYERPHRAVLHELNQAYERASTGASAAIAIVGYGGVGKSRVTQEFAIEARRRGGAVVTARQANNLDYPRRILADLLVALCSPSDSSTDLANLIISRVSRYDAPLATEAQATVKALVGSAGKSDGGIDEQLLISVFMVLLAARSRNGTLIVHLHDLHWCTALVLEFLERMIWQLDHLRNRALRQSAGRTGGLLFVFEGRTGETFSSGEAEWSTHTFELFLSRQNAPITRCRAFTEDESLEFVRRLFEDQHSANKRVPTPLLNLNATLAENINAVAGGNPFYILEQVRYLRQRGIIAQNHDTGLHYAVRPEEALPELPPNVFEAIRARWTYLESTSPRIVQVIGAVALLSERISAQLFNRLWRTIAPEHTLTEFEATEFLRIPAGGQTILFRHESYFQAIRRMGLNKQAMQLAIDTYRSWFESLGALTAQQRYDWARLLLELEVVDFKRASMLLHWALRSAEARHDNALACRILQCLLDSVCWVGSARAIKSSRDFLRICDKDIRLCQLHVSTGERQQAMDRADQLVHRLEVRIQGTARGRHEVVRQLCLRKLRVGIVRVRTLMNFNQPGPAVIASGSIVKELDSLLADESMRGEEGWPELEVDAFHAHAVALALNGEIRQSLKAAERAVAVARQMRPITEGGLDAMGTQANILLAVSPAEAERLLRDCDSHADATAARRRTRIKITINLTMALLLRGYEASRTSTKKNNEALEEAEQLARPVFSDAFAGGRFSDAGAAALIIGLVQAVRNSSDESYWFAQAIDAANRGRQMETLWRAHFNLATSYRRSDTHSSERVREHALASAVILTDTLSSYSCPENSPRFSLIRLPLVEITRFLLEANDSHGERLLAQYPSLRRCFTDPERGLVRSDRGGYSSHEWLRVGDFYYVLY
ncbi:MAG: AAA family ATPase [Proteobacteria bacterium]|nr:AAA family ATPase [Pseudomonadota bacterium]